MNIFFLKIIFCGTYDLTPNSFGKKWHFTPSTFNIKSNEAENKIKEKKGKQWRKQLGAYRLVKPLSYIIVKNI